VREWCTFGACGPYFSRLRAIGEKSMPVSPAL
jgi:hypothetical protein